MVERIWTWRRHLVFGLVLLGAGACAANTPTVEVRVHPRIGLFNAIQFVGPKRVVPPMLGEQAADWQPMTRADYVAAVPALRPLLNKSLGATWDIVTTYRPDASYAWRRAALRVDSPAGQVLTACKSQAVAGVEARTGAVTAGSCVIDLELNTNKAVSLNVLYEARGVAGGQPAAGTLKAEIPEDYLIVIAGDSYASGEGNPDRPCRETPLGFWGTAVSGLISCENGPALWMDEQCHRSMWAAGMRSALLMVQEDKAPGRRNGAYTVINLACSGARVNDGLLGDYPDALPLNTVRKNHPELGLKSALPTEGSIVPSQSRVLKELLAQERARKGKEAADILILSGGGNDLRFGEITAATIMGRTTKDWLRQVRANLEEVMLTYKGVAQTGLARELAEIPADLVLYVPYPDVTGLSSPDALEIRCSEVALPVPAGFGGGHFSISSDERALAYRVLVVDLNRANSDFARDNRVRFIDREALDSTFRRRGWCAEEAGAGPYKPGLRLLRKAHESISYQDDKAGTMHPTFEGHEEIAKEIDKAIAQALQQRFSLLVGDQLAPKAAEAPFVRSPVRFAAGASPAVPDTGYELCWGHPEQGFKNCAKGMLERPHDHGTAENLLVTAIHGQTMLRSRQRVSRLRIDNKAPEQESCRLERPGAAAPMPCESGWIFPADVLVFPANDGDGAGLARMAVRMRGPAAADLPVEFSVASGAARLRAAAVPGGRSDLTVLAWDSVGNVSTTTLTIHVELKPPAVTDVLAYGTPIESGNRAIPAPGGVIDLEVKASDGDSGVKLGNYMVGATSPAASRKTIINPDGLPDRVARCATFSRAQSYVETFSVQSTPSNAPRDYLELWVEGCSGSPSARQRVHVAVLPSKSEPPQSPTVWSSMGRARLTTMLRNSVGAMTSLFSGVPDKRDPGEFAVFSTWLNLADGRVLPGALIAAGFDAAACAAPSTPPPKPITLYTLLMSAEQCAKKQFATNPDGRSALLAKVAEILVASGVLPEL